MKTIILVRHAKSSWSDPSLTDFDRPLNDRGKHDAPLMGKILVGRFPKIDLFLSSTAKRAIKTAKVVAEQIGYPKKEIVKIDELYHASPNRILKHVSKQSDQVNSIAVFAHNPGLTELANQLSKVRIDNLPTTGIFAVQFNVDKWEELATSEGKFLFFEYPKMHKKVKLS